MADYRRDTMKTVTREVPIEECLNGKTREESDLEEEHIEEFVNMTKDIERSKALRNEAEETLDEENLPEATTLLWIDAAEVYSLCSQCYHENSDGAWTGSTQNPNQFELQKKMNERLESGVPCSFCKDERVKEIKKELAEQIDVEVVIIE